MSKINQLDNIKTWLKKHLSELLILILGITISFLLNEWRVSLQSNQDKNYVVNSIKKDLEMDTTILGGTLMLLKMMEEASDSLLRISKPVDNPAMTAPYVHLQMNTISRPFTTSGYLQATSTGGLKLIEDKELVNDLVKLYGVVIPYVESWYDIDRKTVTNEIMPYFNKNFPYSDKFTFKDLTPAQKQKFNKALLSDDFKNMIQTNQIVKGSLRQILKQTKEEMGMILEKM